MAMTRLKNLYTHLIESRLQAVRVWRKHYEEFTKEVETVQTALSKGHKLRDRETYVGTSFEDHEKPFESFAEQLISQA